MLLNVVSVWGDIKKEHSGKSILAKRGTLPSGPLPLENAYKQEGFNYSILKLLGYFDLKKKSQHLNDMRPENARTFS